MTRFYQYECGCRWPIIGELPNGQPLLDFDVEKAPRSCPAVWAMLARGDTKGIFQLESSLGRQWSKKMRPENHEHHCALIALIRPACIKGKDENGVSMTEHYCLRKNGDEETSYFHHSLEPILNKTYGVLTYQEQASSITMAVANFNAQEADHFRKCAAKKVHAEMAMLAGKFLNGAEKAGLTTVDEAKQIWEWLKKCQSYLFNKSHSMAYGMAGYDTAYIKAHFPLAFFTSWLRLFYMDSDPNMELFELVQNARTWGIEVESPDITRSTWEATCSVEGDDRIWLGVVHINGLSENFVEKLEKVLMAGEEVVNTPFTGWSWEKLLMLCGPSLPAEATKKLAECGGFRSFHSVATGRPVGRRQQVADLAAFTSLTEAEGKWLKEHVLELHARGASAPVILRALGRVRKDGGGAANANRAKKIQDEALMLEHPPEPMADTPRYLAWVEERHLHIALTCSRVDSCDLSEVNTSCRDFAAGKTGLLILGVEVNEVRTVRTKKGKNPGAKMAFLTISDSTGSLADVVVFSDVWKEVEGVIIEGRTVALQGEREKGKDTLIVKKAWPLTAA